MTLSDDLKKILSMRMSQAAEHQPPPMACKLFELRDKGTFIPLMAIRVQVTSRDGSYLLRRAGWSAGSDAVYLLDLQGGRVCNYDVYGWGDRTLATAHDFIARNWDDLHGGEVIDVEFIRGEKEESKISEQHG